MNLSNIVTRIKLKLGMMNIATPFDNLDDTIVKILTDITLPIFSVYHPFKQTITLHTNEMDVIERGGTFTWYLLPDFKSRELLYVFDVRYDETSLSGLGYYGGGYPLSSGSTIHQGMLANSAASLSSMMIPKLTFKYEHPRRLCIYHAYVSSRLSIDLGFQHDRSLASIEETARESFIDLALLDVKENLYPTLKHYSEINSAYGNINLKLDDWANAESDRKELINRWDDTYHLDFQPMYYA